MEVILFSCFVHFGSAADSESDAKVVNVDANEGNIEVHTGSEARPPQTVEYFSAFGETVGVAAHNCFED